MKIKKLMKNHLKYQKKDTCYHKKGNKSNQIQNYNAKV